MPSLQDLANELNLKRVENHISQAFKMDFSFKPTKEKSVVKLNGHSICSIGNISIIIAPPGSGKSNVCEAISSGAINPKCDALGFEVDSDRTLLIDTERVFNDLYKGLNRIKRRSGIEEKDIMEKLSVFSFVTLDSIDTCRTELEHLIRIGKYDLVIIDGSADFVKSVNDEEESKYFWRWLIKIANESECGIMLTIHPNPNDEEGKATGHLGSQGQKKAESVFNVFKSKDDKNVRMITTESAHGKVRNAKDKLTASFTWSDEESMFVSCEGPVNIKIKRVKDLFSIKDAFSYKELCNYWIEQTGKSLSDAKRKIKDAEELGDIVKHGGLYYINGTEDNNIEDKENEGVRFDQSLMDGVEEFTPF